MKKYFWYFILVTFAIFYVWLKFNAPASRMAALPASGSGKTCTETECTPGTVCPEGMVCRGTCCIFPGSENEK